MVLGVVLFLAAGALMTYIDVKYMHQHRMGKP